MRYGLAGYPGAQTVLGLWPAELARDTPPVHLQIVSDWGRVLGKDVAFPPSLKLRRTSRPRVDWSSSSTRAFWFSPQSKGVSGVQIVFIRRFRIQGDLGAQTMINIFSDAIWTGRVSRCSNSPRPLACGTRTEHPTSPFADSVRLG